MDTTATFRTAVVRVPAGPASVELIDVPRREPGAGQVRVRIEAASVNPADVWVTDGFFHSIGMINQPDHAGLGWDFAGVVTQAGADVTLPVGARVAGIVPGFDRDFGTYAEEVVADRDWIAVVPDDLELTAAAIVPLNALTADQIVDLLGDGDGQRLLVTGAAGAVGSFVVPLALDRGWVVTGLARTGDESFVRGLGAEFTSEYSHGWDAVADTALLQAEGAALVRDGGTFVGVRPTDVPSPGRGISARAVSVAPDPDRLATLLQLADREVLPTRIADVLPLEKVVEALQRVAAGGLRGRYVLVP
ncbi:MULTISPECIES: NADP-dependent oxidoreductase [Mumia]|uniref:NADP-dependent oxidoreductase n=1 Tax=Mumia TaxID=1546255 RepID=UPI001420D12C|nr:MULTISPECIES: NADP-dependent oxidoreductase [unclassified Mumia]QMW68047.1 NADP-dependent oxidoreductase [Mumia sp. ZJ1417]